MLGGHWLGVVEKQQGSQCWVGKGEGSNQRRVTEQPSALNDSESYGKSLESSRQRARMIWLLKIILWYVKWKISS